MSEGGVGEAKEVNHVEEVVAKDAAFNGAGHLIDGAVDDTCNEGEREVGEIFDKDKVDKGKEKGGHNHAKRSAPLRIEEFRNFPLKKAAEKSLFRNGDEKEVSNEPNRGNRWEFKVDVNKVEIESKDH